jgi:hypothetical protein
MTTPLKIIIIIIALSVVLVSSGFVLLRNGLSSERGTSDDNTQNSDEVNDTLAPTISFVTGDVTGNAGSTVMIAATFNDNVAVTSAKLYYKPATALAWSSKPILTGSASLPLPTGSNESWYYYVKVNDAAGNGPVGDPSSDGSSFYTITVLDSLINPPESNETNDDGDGTLNSSRFVFIELGTKIVCSECPKVSSLLNELYSSEDYSFYYVSLPQDNPKALDRINDYNIWGYPTAYVDGGYATLIGSAIPKSDFQKNISSAAQRSTPRVYIRTTATFDNQTNKISINVKILNHESRGYQGRLRVYITEMISTKWQAGTPMHFSFLDFLANQDVQISANGHLFINNTLSASDLDPENLMIFSVLFNNEKQTRYSQPPDKNPFEAHYVDAVNASRVVQGGNLPPEVGIQNPAVKYFHRFGKPIRKTLTGKTVVVGKTTIVASVHDDSQIDKVEFYLNNKLMGTVTQAPYQWTWHKLSFGKKTITIKAFDDSGKQSVATIDVLAFML